MSPSLQALWPSYPCTPWKRSARARRWASAATLCRPWPAWRAPRACPRCTRQALGTRPCCLCGSESSVASACIWLPFQPSHKSSCLQASPPRAGPTRPSAGAGCIGGRRAALRRHPAGQLRRNEGHVAPQHRWGCSAGAGLSMCTNMPSMLHLHQQLHVRGWVAGCQSSWITTAGRCAVLQGAKTLTRRQPFCLARWRVSHQTPVWFPPVIEESSARTCHMQQTCTEQLLRFTAFCSAPVCMHHCLLTLHHTHLPAGVASATATYPLEVMRRRMMAGVAACRSAGQQRWHW